MLKCRVSHCSNTEMFVTKVNLLLSYAGVMSFHLAPNSSFDLPGGSLLTIVTNMAGSDYGADCYSGGSSWSE
jgi:hypothetical protein